MEKFIRGLPKVEMHIHIEGSLEPEMMLEMAARNGTDVGFGSVEEAKRAYRFENLQSFLDIYYRAAAVLQTERDFYQLMAAYLRRAAEDNVRHAEIFFDPQTHTERGVDMGAVIGGFRRAQEEAEPRITSDLIMCFLRHLSPESALETMREARPYLQYILGVGLDSGERGHPPEPFAPAYREAVAAGLRPVAHAGEEGPAEYIWAALDVLGVERVDHGVRAEDDPRLVERLAAERIPLTMCPLSNQRLQVFPDLADHNLKRLMDAGALVTVNSDDPAYFGGYVADNYLAIARALNLTREDLTQLARNSAEASFLPAARREALRGEIDRYVSGEGPG